MVKKISENEFEEVREKDVAVIDFSAEWCMPCKMLAPVLEEVSEEMSEKMGIKVSFYNVDVDENLNLAQQYGIVNIPALVVLKNGEKQDMQVGFQPKDAIISFVKSNIN